MMRIETTQPTKRNNAQLMLTTATGAALGMGARYIIPTKNEFKNLKGAADSFFSNASTAARGANRSMLKYGAIGALIAATVSLLTKLISSKNDEPNYTDTFEYSQFKTMFELPEVACELYIYEN